MNYTEHYTRGATPQTEQADPRQELNNAGGYTFVTGPWLQLHRFLVMGSEGGTFYVSEQKLTRENAQNVVHCLQMDPERTLQLTAVISSEGRAPKNSPAIFVLALAASDPRPSTRALVGAHLNTVCRTASHLFEWVAAVDKMRRWGKGLQRAIGRWYEARTPTQLMHQAAKYRQRGGWSHRDLLRKSHWSPKSPQLQAIARWMVKAPPGERSVTRMHGTSKVGYQAGPLPAYLEAFDELQACTSLQRVCGLVAEHGFTHEMIPSQWLDTQQLWAALVQEMPATALLRNLGRMTKVGMSQADIMTICQKLTDPVALKHGRIHPISVLIALKVYAQGHGDKGSLRWTPNVHVIDALDEAFYMAFGAIEPTGKRVLLAIDVSGSMDINKAAGTPVLSAREAAAAMAMCTARSEPDWQCLGFSHKPVTIPISPRQRLDDVIATMKKIPMGATDCSLPMLLAEQTMAHIDMFQVYTDNETFFGSMHPHEALKRYRACSGVAAKLAVLAVTATNRTIADPTDPGMLDIVGFDAAVPAILRDFALS